MNNYSLHHDHRIVAARCQICTARGPEIVRIDCPDIRTAIREADRAARAIGWLVEVGEWRVLCPECRGTPCPS